MQAIRVQTEDGGSYGSYVRPALPLLPGLVERIGEEGDTFLVMARLPDDPDDYVQVLREPGGDAYQLEYRDGSPDRHFQAFVASAAEVVRVMSGWAGREKGWELGPAWERLEFPAEEAPPPLDPEVEEQLSGIVRGWLRCGYRSRAGLVEDAEDNLVVGDVRPVSRAQAQELVDRLWRERAAEQGGWLGETDPERLTRAFEALEASGITARENFTCCRSCGLGEIWADGEEDARGFVFFHSQCTEGAAEGHDLYLLYGGFEPDGELTASVGREVTAALDAVGLGWLWDGSAHDAIRVTGLDWRRRLTA
ncbi:hypothetical protein OOK31_23975 [Streptomyces sp. NBC_00249]|uniref:DUF6891 domain-containing protein n=1 Tax=Streptomyces sp. NBC_00249 TaxID=2975690 RepID=UPI0022595CCC|nr:hypothetical protein [Streptomyces sp. NBC_00249]MCX5196916.1 hypothetical protein [Streptomyces sp. NBC_00249]